jgi:hypothetical protein
MNEITCSHGNGPECSKCEALDIPEVEELERELRARIAELEAVDAAKAGEARAVEAIKGLLNELHEFDFEIDGSVEFFDSVQQCRDATDNTQPALDWLAQREREAAARELRLLADGCATVNPVLSWQLRACADGLTDQQPTACSRSEVRGKERL